MWSTKISFDGSKNVVGGYVKKRGIRMLVFPLGWSYEKDDIIVNYSGVVFGDEKGKRGFFRDWKKDKSGWMREIEINGDFFIGKVREPIEGRGLYNRNLVYTRPWLIEESGRQTIVVSAFEKKYLEKFIGVMEKFHKIKIDYIRKEKLGNISFSMNAPDLTEKQKFAMNLAVRSGYYDYPRKISIKDMAKVSGVGFATFHGHLRKAEKAMMPFLFRK